MINDVHGELQRFAFWLNRLHINAEIAMITTS